MGCQMPILRSSRCSELATYPLVSGPVRLRQCRLGFDCQNTCGTIKSTFLVMVTDNVFQIAARLRLFPQEENHEEIE